MEGLKGSLRARRFLAACLIVGTLCLVHHPTRADEPPTADDITAGVTDGKSESAVKPEVASKVDVSPVNQDDRIAQRLRDIFEATGWFERSEVRVDRGVVFLSGVAKRQEHREWAEATAIRTGNVAAVVNRIRVDDPPVWNFAPAWASMKQLARETTGLMPLILVAIVMTVLAFLAARVGRRLATRIAASRMESRLLSQVVGNAIAVLIFIIGFYVALRVSGLTRLAVTLLGGTGLIGLALGFAFRDIAENYLASILISLNHPFRVGDLIEVDGATGFVRKVTTRGTVLNTLEGNQIQIPNSTVYKNKVTNFTATPALRLQFTVGIGFDAAVSDAQEILMRVFADNAAVKSDPAPLVLVDSLGSSTVNLRCMYWIDQHQHSGLKVGSNVIRMAKEALMNAGISMPDEARELVFPQGVPVRVLAEPGKQTGNPMHSDAGNGQPPAERPQRAAPHESTFSKAEGDLSNERGDVLRVTEDEETLQDQANLID
ncbi:MAG: mechanosensitive ion channel domain-containing protein [Planctomycetota bacterium]